MKSINIHTNELRFKREDLTLYIAGCGLGFGVDRYLSLFTLLLAAYVIVKRLPLLRPNLMAVMNLLLIVIFFAVYWMAYVPPKIDFPLSWYGYLAICIYTMTAGALALTAISKEQLLLFLLFIAIGMLMHALIVTTATVAIMDPPYYGQVYSPMKGSVLNSPRYSNMASFFAWSICAISLFNGHNIKGRLKPLFLFGFCASLFIGVTLGGRAYLVVVLLALVLAWVPTSLSIKGIKSIFLIVFMLVVCDVLANYFLESYQVGRELLIQRFNTLGLDSLRFALYADWANQIVTDPFTRPSITLSIEPTYWFHNFWMDVHRTSGFIAFLFACALFVVPTYQAIGHLVTGAPLGWRLLILLVCVALIFATSVPLEGGDSGMFAYFAALAVLISSRSLKC